MVKPYITIKNRKIGEDYPPLVIAEIGINHNGEIEKAKQMVLDAHKAGVECVKFQIHVVEDEMIPAARKVIPPNADEPIYDMMERCALTEEEDLQMKKLVEGLGMIYLATPFSRAAADQLHKMDVDAYKIGSGECNNIPLLRHIASFGKPVIISTGMNDLESIKASLKVFDDANVEYVVLHCTSMYPTPYNKVRLGAMNDLKDAFPNAVLGLSDHSLGNYTCFAAIPLGAAVLEKHFTSDKTWPGSDIEISIDPEELSELVKGSKAVHQSLGGKKEVLEEEQGVIDFAYATVVSTQAIPKGTVLSNENTWVKRPGVGKILAKDYENVLGKTAVKDIDPDAHIDWDDFE